MIKCPSALYYVKSSFFSGHCLCDLLTNVSPSFYTNIFVHVSLCKVVNTDLKLQAYIPSEIRYLCLYDLNCALSSSINYKNIRTIFERPWKIMVMQEQFLRNVDI